MSQDQEPKNKEQVYDEEISPLVHQILRICDKHRIATLCHFAIPTPEEDSLSVTSCLPFKDEKNIDEKIALAKVFLLRGQDIEEGVVEGVCPDGRVVVLGATAVAQGATLGMYGAKEDMP